MDHLQGTPGSVEIWDLLLVQLSSWTSFPKLPCLFLTFSPRTSLGTFLMVPILYSMRIFIFGYVRLELPALAKLSLCRDFEV